MSSEFNFIKCLEWCTKLPKEAHLLESPVFLLQGYECLLRFISERENSSWLSACRYKMHMVVKTEISELKPCNVKVSVGFDRQKDFILGESTITFSAENKGQEIWQMSGNDLKEKLPPDYERGNWIKFRISFGKIKNKMEDKCFQTASYLNGDLYVENNTEDMFKVLDTDTNHGVEIKCGEQSIKAHKLILCGRSEVLKAMLESDMVEGRTGVVEIKDIDESCIEDFVKYLYTERIPELTFEKAKVLYEAGDKYAVRSLMLRCSEYLQDTLSLENALECFALADAHADEDLRKSVTTFCLEKKMYLQEKFWLPFCESYPKVALDVYSLSYLNDI